MVRPPLTACSKHSEADAFPDHLQGVLPSRALQQESSVAWHLLLPWLENTAALVVWSRPLIPTSKQPRLESSPGVAFSSLRLPEIVGVWPLTPHTDSRNHDIPCNALVRVAPTLPVHSLAASKMVHPLVPRVPANTEAATTF